VAPRKLETPWTRRQLITELALSDKTQTRLAEEYGVTQQSVSDFAARHANEIQVVREHTEDEFAGLALAVKANRLATYEDIVRRLTVQLNEADAIDEKTAASLAKILRNVAEELGHLPNRVTLGGEVGVTTRYTVEGVDPGAMQ
jgi:predicted transcriptional regulator